jgi:uncharacterized RDD family membrane protein YckC
MDNWYYAQNGAQVGPVSQATLVQLLASGQVPVDSLVWCTGMAEWVAASTLPELSAPRVAVTQPVIGYGVGDTTYLQVDNGIRFAGFWTRFASSFIDGIITTTAMTFIGLIEGAVLTGILGSNSQAADIGKGITGLMNFVLPWLYFAFLQTSATEGSVGMMAVGIKVTNLSGGRITFGQATGRYFASLLSGCLLGIGYLMMLWSPRKQTLHDQLAGTLVIHKQPRV